MFHRLAPVYDLQYAGKDYEGETARLIEIVRRFGRSGGSRWLDIGCGTGRHLEALRRSYRVVGVDLSADMLRIARKRLPGIPLHRGDMRTVRVPGSFDVVTCLFSAVGHLADRTALAQAYENFARHLAPGGVALVEPWIDPAKFEPGHVHLLSTSGPGLSVARMSWASRRGERSVIDYHFLIGRPQRGVETLATRDIGYLATPTVHRTLLRRAGLRPRFVRPAGFLGNRGLWVGVKPTRRSGSHGAPVGRPHAMGPELRSETNCDF